MHLLNPFGLANAEICCLPSKRSTVGRRRMMNGRMHNAPLCLKICFCFWAHTYDLIWGRTALKAVGAWLWLITCVQCWEAFKLKQNGLYAYMTSSNLLKINKCGSGFYFGPGLSLLDRLIALRCIIVSKQTWDATEVTKVYSWSLQEH